MTIFKKADDFTIVNRSNAAATGGKVEMYAVIGPGLNQIGLQYQSRDEAEEKGRELTEKARVSLWYEPDANRTAGELVISYREPWFRIVKFYPTPQRIGPSVPFVLGAIQRPVGAVPDSEDIAKQKLLRLLTQMHDETPNGFGIQILWCSTIKAYVVTADRWSESSKLTTSDEKQLVRVEAHFDFLWNLYGHEILRGHYSIDDQVWHAFKDDEEPTIHATLRQ